MDALFLDHYDRELAYLREMGNAFASKYPKLAGQLGLDAFHCSDPFVERLLEGFAFLSARVQRRMDAEYPQLTRSLLDTVFPHYSRPIPSTGIFQLNPAHDEGSLVEGYTVPKGTRLNSQPAHGQQTGCRFETTAETTLWPIRIAHVSYQSRDSVAKVPLPAEFHRSEIRGVLRLVLETTAAVPVKALKLDTLRLHLRGGEVAHQIFESLIAHTHAIAVGAATAGASNATSYQLLDAEQIICPTGRMEEMLFPNDHRTFSGYQLLQEYFLLPEKFLFVELKGLQSAISQNDSNQLTLLFAIDHQPGKQIERVSSEHLALHCVPAVNLFLKRTDRIHLDYTQHEHALIGDRGRPLDYEIWSIEEMAAHETATAHDVPCLPIYAPPKANPQHQSRAIYYAIDRRPRLPGDQSRFPMRSSYAGTEVFLHLTDSSNQPSCHHFQQLSATAYCTNRDLPLLTPEKGWRTAFHIEAAGPIANVLCLTGPTRPRSALVSDDGEAAWRLISHLTPNYLSLMDSEDGGSAMLRDLLQLYCFPEDQASHRQVEGLQSVRHQSIVRRIPLPGPLTFAQGLEIELSFDEEAFDGGGAFLLGSILEQFFSRFVSLNSFTETHFASQQRGVIHQWPARIGATPLL
jgi:type VI secretion system protein ImpG